MLDIVERIFTSNIAYCEIKRKIIELEYEPDMPLNEEKLTEELEISRTPLRQALYRLGFEGLIIKLANGRMRVAPVSIKEAEKIFKVREVLEGLIAKEATNNLSKVEIMHLESTLELMIFAAEKNSNFDSIKHGSDFHHELYEPSQNEIAVQFLNQLNDHIERYRRFSGYKNPNYIPMLPVREHQKILDAIKKGNPELAEKEMRAHIRRSFEMTKDTLRLVLN
nr:GntR family transcriptional regulator [Fredinandcohnia onubensis]